MGDAEFDGGGSVTWEVKNSDGESGGGNKDKCKGKDKDPRLTMAAFPSCAGEDSMFTTAGDEGKRHPVPVGTGSA